MLVGTIGNRCADFRRGAAVPPPPSISQQLRPERLGLYSRRRFPQEELELLNDYLVEFPEESEFMDER